MKNRLFLLNTGSLLNLIDLYLEDSLDDNTVDLTEIVRLVKSDKNKMRILETGIKIGFLNDVTYAT